MKLVQRCKEFAHNINKIRKGEYRYSFSNELMKPRPSTIKPKQGKPMTKKEQLGFQNDINKQEAKQDEVLRNNATLPAGLVSNMIPMVIDPKWKPREETPRDARNAALLEYNKHKSPPLSPEDFLVCSEEDITDKETLDATDHALSARLEELLKPQFDFTDDFDYHDDGYFWGRPLFNFIVVDLLKLTTPPKTIRYWAADWMDYGSYHYPKRTHFNTKEEKQMYRQIHDWTMPAFDLKSLFLPNGRLNFDYQPPPWELPVPFSLGLPHLDDRVKGVRMFDVYRMFAFEALGKQTVNLLDVHREFENVWERNAGLSPYIAQMAVNARVRAEYNLFGPKEKDTKAWNDYTYQLKRFWTFFVSLFIKRNARPKYSFTRSRKFKKMQAKTQSPPPSK